MTQRDGLAACPYRIDLVDAAQARIDAQTLACVRYGRGLAALDDPRVIDIDLDVLGAAPQAQLWRSSRTVTAGRDDGIAYNHDGAVLFGSLRLEESSLRRMDDAACDAYTRIAALLERLGYPGWLRVWIYMAGITRGDGDAERYRQFSLGRHRALALTPGFEANLPAATAIGTRGAGLSIHFLAARDAGLQVENPRQVSAFRYPREYGPRSPSFSRATLKHWADVSQLFVSGTASIVGHESRHDQDAALQLEEIALNIEALRQDAVARHLPGRRADEWLPLGIKLYLRERGLLDALRPQARRLFGEHTPLMALEGDICRRNLRVEVEAIYAMPQVTPDAGFIRP